jgi:hypothetical protein
MKHDKPATAAQDTIESIETEILKFLDENPSVLFDVIEYLEGLSLTDYRERDAKRRELVNLALTTYKRIIYAAILSQVDSFVQDYSMDPDDLYIEVVSLIWDLADELEQQGKAKLSTRLCQLAKRHAANRRNKAQNRYRLVTENIDRIREGGATTYSDDELADIRASENNL